MWRRSSNEEWERTKSYLIRSLFEDIPQLSDVAEEAHSAIESHSGNRDRSYSPLPELIIEKIPDRHDEPEEYYEQLTIRMRKIYKKLFKPKVGTNYDDGYGETVGLKFDSDLEGMTSFPYSEQNSNTKNKYALKDEENQTNFNEMNTAGEINNIFSIEGLSRDDQNSDTTPDSNEMKTGSGFKEDVDQTKSANADEINYELDKTYSIPSPNATDLISNSTTTNSCNEADVNNADFSKIDKRNGEFDNTNYFVSNPSQSDPDSENIDETNITESDERKNDFEKEEETETTYSDNDSPESEEITLKKRKHVSYHFNSKTLSTIPEESDQERDESNSYVFQMNTAVSKKQVHNSNDHDDSLAITFRARSSKASILSFEKNEIEVMRGERKTSLESLIVYPENNSILNKSFTARDISFEVDDVQEESVESVEFQREIQQCSSPKISNEHNKRLHELSCKSDNGHFQPVTLPRRKRNSNEENSIVFAKKNKTDEATQTDKSSVTWDTLKRNFFVGVPKMYNLCTCKNHKCNL